MPDTTTSLADKTLVMVVGPSAIGKSTLMNEVVRQDNRFGRVRSFTTRPPRSNDEPGHYIYFNDEELARRSENGEILTDVIFPTTGHHYGTVAESYGSTFNLLDTLAHSVETYRALPFKHTVTISLTTNPDAWQKWLRQRFPNGGKDMELRLEEAMSSMEWSLAQTNDHHWLVNLANDIPGTAERLISIVMGDKATTEQPLEATRMLERAKLLLSYE